MEGFPHAIRCISVSGPKARHLSDLVLHTHDLQNALSALDAINKVPIEPFIIREALWHTAIILFCKCFDQHQSRCSLTFEKVFGVDSPAYEAFKYFDSLRDKHLVHDENSYAQCPVGAVVNAEGSEHKIAKIVATPAFGVTLEQSNFANLHRLITITLDWLANTSNELCNSITVDLNRQPHSELLGRPDMSLAVPAADDVHKARLKPV